MENIYKIFDTHCHYDDEQFDDDRDEVLKEIEECGVIGILNCASSYKSIKTIINIINNNEFAIAALGIHPEYAEEINEDVLCEIERLIEENDKVVAIGEIGLDYYWKENPSKEVQKAAFRKQMKLAEKLNLPVIIHDREAHLDTLNIMKEFPNVKGIVHCFSGSVEFAKECVKLGYYIGITGVVTFKNSKKLKSVVREVPLERLLVETDAPYMAPTPNRGKRNRSDYIRFIIEEIADIKEIDPLEVNLITNQNFQNLINK